MTIQARASGAVEAGSGAPNTEVIEQMISAVTVAHIVMINTLHAQGVVDRKHFAHAFARAIDALAANPRNRLVTAIVQVIKNAAMQAAQGAQPDVQSWLRALVDGKVPLDEQN
jgi:hypothetical protein